MESTTQDAALQLMMASAVQSCQNHLDSITTFQGACTAARIAQERVTDLKAKRAAKKAGALLRLMEQGYTATKADDLSRLDPDYDQYKRQVERAERELQAALDHRGAVELATDNARLGSEMITAQLRVLMHFPQLAGQSPNTWPNGAPAWGPRPVP